MRILRVLDRKVRVALRLGGEANYLLRRNGIRVASRFVSDTLLGVLRDWIGFGRAKKTNVVDRQFGTDTAENAKLHGLDIKSPNYRYGVYYKASDLASLDEVLAQLPIQHSDYTFIDYGSGKGLVLLQASSYPFKHVIGVEFARELHEIACENVRRYPEHLRATSIDLFHGDALEFDPPEGNLCLYLYEPFEAAVTERLIRRIEEFQRSRDVVVACVYSQNASLSCRPLWESAACLTKVAEGGTWAIYRGFTSPASRHATGS